MKYLVKVFKSKPFIVAVALIFIYTLAGFLLTPYLVRHYVPKVVREKIEKEGSIGKVRFNPYVFTFEANDFRINEPDGSPIMGFRRLFIDFELKSLFKWAWTFRRVSLEGLGVHAVIDREGRLNLASLAPPSKASSRKKKDAQPPTLIFEELLIEEGRIDAIDKRQSQPAAIAIHPLTLQMKNLTTVREQEGVQTFTASTAGGEKIQWSGKISLNPVAASGSFSIENLKFSTLSQFARDALNLEQPEGKLTFKADYSVDLGGEKTQVLLSNLSVALTGLGLKLHGAENPFLELPDALLSGGRFDLSGRKVDVGSVRIKGGRARIAVSENGKLDVQRIAKSSGADVPHGFKPPVQRHGDPWKIVLNGFELDGFAVDYEDLSRTSGLRGAVDQLSVGLKAEFEAGSQTKMSLNDVTVGVSGIQAGLPDSTERIIRIDTVGLHGGVYNLSNNRFTADKISVAGGHVDVRRQRDGNLNLAVLFQPGKGVAAKTSDETATEGQPFGFLVNDVSLSGLQAVFSDLTVREDSPILSLEDVSAAVSNVDGRSPMKFNLGIRVREGGRIEAAGTVDPSAPSVDSEIRVTELGLTPFQPFVGKAAEVILKSGTFSTRGNLRHGIKSAGAQTAYHGGFKVEKLRITESDGKETLVGWKSLESNQLSLKLGPDKLDLGEVKVSEPTGKIIIEKDGSFNLAQVIKKDARPKREEKPPSGTADVFTYRLDRVLMSRGQVDFADMSLRIPFGTKVHELKGSITGISSARKLRAQVKLDGRVDDYGTVKVGGEMNTSAPKEFTDISVLFRNVEMSRLTPYSGKFAGRKIESGKLSVDLKYKIENSQLAGDNQIVVVRLKLGEKVESPDAVNLPLDLAVALLEDSSGVIDLGLPVHGDLDSPDFSYGSLIFKAIVNVVTRIATSPFRALAALIPGGGEETFKNIAFEAGSAEVPPPEKEKLAKLAAALQKRPQLRLTVQGRYNPETDRSVLRTAALSRALAARLGQKVESDAEPVLVDYSSPEIGKALERMFRERFGADEFKKLKSELKAAREKAKKEGKPDARAADAEHPAKFAQLLFARLQEVEPLDEAALVRLADTRAQAIIEELGGKLSIPAERLSAASSAAVEKSEPIEAALSLDIIR
jgi:hypothetical protein